MAPERQSPVDILATAPVHEPDIDWAYQPSVPEFGDNPIAVQFDVAPGSHAIFGGSPYRLVQFHFHSPAEHRLDGERAPMELHLVHESAEGTLAAVGVWLVEGAHNPAFDPIVDTLPRANTESLPVTVDPSALLPADRRYVSYQGSLTTPPYSTGVTWHMLLQPITITAAQLAALRAPFHGNSRPIQPLNGRSFL